MDPRFFTCWPNAARAGLSRMDVRHARLLEIKTGRNGAAAAAHNIVARCISSPYTTCDLFVKKKKED
ncbi:hypothetical protein FJU30_20785 [Affinibrenneria salicis]|uniref:Uncharacterized protein n=2 Tax=Affinibrenneria salicis TaxID=2590031 RepID=A0A5J5FTI8_9GAMM|nr:hypothetical protein FJU30_20785 [Affinibrenneria salicis]